LWYFENRDEWDNMDQIFKSHKSLFDEHNFIGATRNGKNYWYWSHSGESLNANHFDWGVNQPSDPMSELCSNIFLENGKVVLNDISCLHQHSRKFLCVDVLYS
jgi:hypothetical protein